MKKEIIIGLNLLLFMSIGLFLNKAFCQVEIPFKSPPDEFSKLVLKKEDPTLFFSPDGQWVLICEATEYVSLNELSSVQKNLAGINILTESFSVPTKSYTEMYFIDVYNNKRLDIYGLPKNLKASNIKWSHSGNNVAFTQTNDTSIDLFVISTTDKSAVKYNKERLNLVAGTPYQWINDNCIAYKTVPIKNNIPPEPTKMFNPVIYQSGQKIPNTNSTLGLLQSDSDDQLFKYYLTAQLVINKKGKEHNIGKPQMYADFHTSPNQQYILATTFQSPFSRKVKHYQFARNVDILDIAGRKIKQIATLPVLEQQSSRDNVANYGRQFSWIYNKPACVYWFQPLDSGLMEKKVEYHDALYNLDVLSGKEQILFKSKNRIKGFYWVSDSLALVEERNIQRNMEIFALYNWGVNELQTLYTQNITGENRKGTPVISKINNQVLTTNNGKIIVENLLQAEPFLLALNGKQGIDTLWKYDKLKAESYYAFLAPKQITVTKKKLNDNIVYHFYPAHLKAKSIAQLSFLNDFDSPLTKSTYQIINYKRKDDVLLSGTLRLPANYDIAQQGRLPILIWGYPSRYDSLRVYKPRQEDTKKTGAFLTNVWEAPVIWTLAGYAVIEVDMPILGGKYANESYLKQIILNAKAAIDKLVTMGIGDSSRVVVGGHSYGAAMVANLLAHTNYFKAGIAMSGAYNRMNTPFGFQDERRSFWEAQTMYDLNSPIRYADKIKTPLLLIHGENDQVAGTPVEESINFFKAIEKNGGTVKLLVLRNEGHVYQAKENIMHLFAEELEWLQRYVK